MDKMALKVWVRRCLVSQTHCHVGQPRFSSAEGLARGLTQPPKPPTSEPQPGTSDYCGAFWYYRCTWRTSSSENKFVKDFRHLFSSAGRSLS